MFRKMLTFVLVGLALACAHTTTAEAHGWGRYHGWGHYGWNTYRPAYRYGGWYGSGISYRTTYYAPLAYYRPIVYSRPIFYAPRVFSYYPAFNFAPAYYPSCDVSCAQPPVCTTNYAPVYYPAETAYGPQANQQFWGNPFYSTTPRNSNQLISTVGTILQALQAAKQNQNQGQYQPQPQQIINASQPQLSMPIARSRARSMMVLGDRYFAEQKYNDAATKYREASTTAPDLDEAHFRLAHAYTAMGRMDAAAASFRRAIGMSTDITRQGFRLDDLYGNSQTAKRSHIESAAAAALADPDRSDSMLVVGMFLQYDGQAERAGKFLARARDLGENPQLIASYLNDKPLNNTVLQVKAVTDEI
jgi:tetratricopeptide (TPR) repeat protein